MEASSFRLPKRIERIFGMTRRLVSRKPARGHCTVCGRATLFLDVTMIPRESFKCIFCRSISRNRHLAKVMCNFYGMEAPFSLKRFAAQFSHLSLYETQARGPLHNILRTMPHYFCSEFLPDTPPGSHSLEGIRCEDLQALTFSDESFDLVVTQDVFEHIRDPESALAEINRILKPGGVHFCTVPIERDRLTMRRIELNHGREHDVLPRIYHSDNVRDGLVYTEYGNNIGELFDRWGFRTEQHWCNEFDTAEHSIYWSCVLISRKT